MSKKLRQTILFEGKKALINIHEDTILNRKYECFYKPEDEISYMQMKLERLKILKDKEKVLINSIYVREEVLDVLLSGDLPDLQTDMNDFILMHANANEGILSVIDPINDYIQEFLDCVNDNLLPMNFEGIEALAKATAYAKSFNLKEEKRQEHPVLWDKLESVKKESPEELLEGAVEIIGAMLDELKVNIGFESFLMLHIMDTIPAIHQYVSEHYKEVEKKLSDMQNSYSKKLPENK